MTVYLASDHGGFALKEALKPYVLSLGHEVEDCGAYELEEGDDYPDFVTPCARLVASREGAMGIIIGASGEGEAMAANRVPGARAAVYYGPSSKKQTDASGTELSLLAATRAHNDANLLALGARYLSEEEAKDAVREFLSTAFSGDERHLRRLKKLG